MDRCVDEANRDRRRSRSVVVVEARRCWGAREATAAGSCQRVVSEAEDDQMPGTGDRVRARTLPTSDGPGREIVGVLMVRELNEPRRYTQYLVDGRNVDETTIRPIEDGELP